MANIITPGVTEFEREDLVTDERFNLMVAELAAKIAEESGAGALKPEDVINTLLSTEIAKPLSANQGKVLKGLIDGNTSAIGQLQTDKQDGITKIKDINCHSLIINKEYIINNTDKSASGNSNLNYPNVSGLFHLKVESTLTKDYGNGVYYTAKSRDFGTIYTKFEVNGTYSPWKEIATTEKYTLQASDMRNGWILSYGNIIQKIGNRVFARFVINSGATTVGTVVCNFPIGFRPIAEAFVTVRTYATAMENPVNQFVAIYPDGNAQIRNINSKPFIFIEASWEV